MIDQSGRGERARRLVRRLITGHDGGAGMVEYALLVLLVAIALIAAVSTLGGAVAASFIDSASRFPK